VIAEPQYAKALRGEKSIALSVAHFLSILEVLPAIDLDDELCGMRHEVDDVRTDRRLAAKAGAFKTVRTQAVPDDALCLGEVLSKRASA